MKRQTVILLPLLFVAFVLLQGVQALGQSDETGALKTVSFEGHTLRYSPTLANQIIILDNEAGIDEADIEQPPHIEIALTYVGNVPSGAVRFYRVADIADDAAGDQIQALRRLLAERPDLDEQTELPTLHPFMSAENISLSTVTFVSQARYFETAGYDGIVFINGRHYKTSSSEPAGLYRLTFEGLSADENWYVSAYFHLSIPEWPESVALPAFDELDPELMRDIFEAFPADTFQPSLELLEQVFTSIDHENGDAQP